MMSQENLSGQEQLGDDEFIEATRHWLSKAVVGLNLCPFAGRVVGNDSLRIVVSQVTEPLDLLLACAEELQLLSSTPASETETSLLVAPKVLRDFIEFNDFLGLVDDLLEDLGLDGVFQVASFHPDYQFADSAANDIGNFTNRSPYPTLHFLREDSVSAAVDAFGDTDKIIEQNQTTLKALGLAGWRQLMTR